MDRPRGREKNVTGPAKKVEKRGSGLGTGPVGSGQSGGGSSGSRSGGGKRSGGGLMKLIILLAVLLLGGGGSLGALMGGQGGESLTASAGQTGAPSGGGDISALFGSLGGGSVSGGWAEPANTGRLDETVAPGARAGGTIRSAARPTRSGR